MSATVLICGRVFDGISEELAGPLEILVEGNRIIRIGPSVDRPSGASLIDLSDRTIHRQPRSTKKTCSTISWECRSKLV